MVPRILSDIPLSEIAVRKLESLPGVTLHQLPPHDAAWDLSDELLPGPEILLCKLPARNLDALGRLKMIQLSSVGYEHLRHLGFADRPVRVCNARGIFDTAIAEWNLAMMVNLIRDLPGMMRNQRDARWERADRFQQEIRGRVLGLWGYGGIGRETARLAKACGMTVHVMTRSGLKPRENTFVLRGTGDPDGILPDRVFLAGHPPHPHPLFPLASGGRGQGEGGQTREFLSGLDFLILALPHTRESEGMIGEAELKALPRSAFILNPARGPIIQEKALIQALHEGWIAGAALDTHFAYPLPADHPLWQFPNVILTPHVSGADKSPNFPDRIADLFIQNVNRYLEGRPLLNEITTMEWREA
jgi:phosphoglycerate dehydrogenase-like enzyme